ncbi:MAG: hypothetical protein KAQ83_02425 [Nanoarchaeota archaeon]|nr:hypothetical protein [Nanoarchaeota archaeon]
MCAKYSSKVVAVKRARIKFKNNFHMKNLYYFMYDWIVQQGWVPRNDPDFPEIFMGHNEAAGGGTEIWWAWRPKQKVNEYLRWVLNIDVHVILLRSVEIMKGKEKYKTNWGEVEIILNSHVETDWQGKWANHSILKHFETMYRLRLYKDDIGREKKKLIYETYRFQNALKDFLDIQRTGTNESEGGYFPRGGIGE